MKKLLFLLLFLPLLAFTQVPQGVGYQGVATDANGIELVNQSISIRASIISASPTGTIEWQETHNTSTDTFGLFTLTIGQGTSTGNGAQTSFADITWGANTHFLKIEMDVNGGTNYSHMGTNQMMSVPYALYAENANIDYDSISTLLSNDSTFITTVSGGIGDGCDYFFPDGLDGDIISIDILQGNYTVPSGKNLYLLNAFCTAGGTTVIDLDGNNFIKFGDPDFGNVSGKAMVGSGSVLSLSSYNGTSNSSMIYGKLVDKQVDVVSIDMLQGNYTVPSGKNLYFVTAYCNSGHTVIDLDGNNFIKYNDLVFTNNRNNIAMVGSGSTLSVSSNTGNPTSNMIYGYLADENFFADCGGGGGGSSTSTIDSSYIDSLVQFYSSGNAGGCNSHFPDGFGGESIIWWFNTSVGDFTVPNGKTFYMLRETCVCWFIC